jgi:ketosteroid isomerase-like protein
VTTPLEAWRRYSAALHDRDWEALGEVIDEDVVAIDHRPLGFGTIEGRDAFVDYVQGMIAVAPDIQLEMTRMLRGHDDGIVAELRWHGSSAGAPIESTYAIDARVANGRLVHAVFFEVGDPRVEPES